MSSAARGASGPDGSVDPYSHFINVYMLDRDGNRIDRRNPQDIFVPLYNKQIPPGAGQVVHFGLEVPKGRGRPDHARSQGQLPQVRPQLLDYVFGQGKGPKLPVVVMARDEVQLPIAGGRPADNEPSPIEATWQRWNDYGIGLLLEGSTKGGQKGELKQAERVFLEGGRARACRWLGEPGSRVPAGRADSRCAVGAREGRRPRGAGRALGHQLADRPDQRQQRPARRGDREL